MTQLPGDRRAVASPWSRSSPAAAGLSLPARRPPAQRAAQLNQKGANPDQETGDDGDDRRHADDRERGRHLGEDFRGDDGADRRADRQPDQEGEAPQDFPAPRRGEAAAKAGNAGPPPATDSPEITRPVGMKKLVPA